jgi:hypothetical protein
MKPGKVDETTVVLDRHRLADGLAECGKLVRGEVGDVLSVEHYATASCLRFNRHITIFALRRQIPRVPRH